MGAIYNMNHLDNLRHFSQLYFHGHSVGGTNPSLLEAMACQTQIIAHNNEFNRGILGDDAFYFNNSAELSTLLQTDSLIKPVFKTNNYQKILNLYPPLSITDQYEMLFKSCLSKQ
jgi:glycosyltransferase involved in cell wall biosynthesis